MRNTPATGTDCKTQVDGHLLESSTGRGKVKPLYKFMLRLHGSKFAVCGIMTLANNHEGLDVHGELAHLVTKPVALHMAKGVGVLGLTAMQNDHSELAVCGYGDASRTARFLALVRDKAFEQFRRITKILRISAMTCNRLPYVASSRLYAKFTNSCIATAADRALEHRHEGNFCSILGQHAMLRRAIWYG